MSDSLSPPAAHPATPFWLVEFLMKDQLLSLWRFPWMLLAAFLLLLLIFFSLCLIFVSLINMCLSLFLLGFILMGLSELLRLDWLLSQVRKVFNYNLFKNFLRPYLFLFFFWAPYNLNVGALNVILEVCETILNIFNSFIFILLFISYFHHSSFQLTYPFLCHSYSALDSFHSIFNFSHCVIFHCLFFLYFFLVLVKCVKYSCIFSILFSRFWIFTIITLCSFSGGLPISFVDLVDFYLFPSFAQYFSVFPFS